MADFDIVYLANCDVIAGDLTKSANGKPALLGAFNLVSVTWKPRVANVKLILPDVGDPVLFPWMKAAGAASRTPAVSGDFVILTNRQLRYDRAPAPSLVQFPVTAIQDKLAEDLEKAFLLLASGCPPEGQGKRDFTAAIAGATDGEFNDRTWTAILAGVSQQGYPIAPMLGLSSWLDTKPRSDGGEPYPWSDAENRRVAVVPATLHGLAFEKAEFKSTEQSFEIQYGKLGDRPVILLRTNTVQLGRFGAIAEHENCGASLFKPFVGKKQEIDAGTFANWVSTLPRKIGDYLDLGWILHSTLPSPGGREAKAIRKEIIEPMLLLFHDHADLGLRTPFYAFGPERKAEDLSASIAFELLGHAARSMPNAPHNADERLRGAFSLLAKEAKRSNWDFLYPWAKRWDATEPVLMEWAKHVLLPTLQQIDGIADEKQLQSEVNRGADKKRSHSGQYEDLWKVLRFEAGQELELSGEEMARAWVQLSRLQEDENFLLVLFCTQWDLLLDHLKKESLITPRQPPVQLDKVYGQFLTALSMEDDKAPPSAEKPRAIVGGRPRELIREYLQQGHIRLAERYGDALTTDILGKLQELGDPKTPENGEFFKLSSELVSKGRPTSEAGRTGFRWPDANTPAGHSAFLQHSAWLAAQMDANNLPGKGSSITSAVRTQLFQASAYLGKALTSYWAGRGGFFPPPLHAGVRAGWNEAAHQKIAHVSFQPPPASTKVDNKPHWKEGAWAAALIGLDRTERIVPTPPPLTVPLVVEPAEYDPARYSGVLVLGKRSWKDGETDAPATPPFWWILNVGQPCIGPIKFERQNPKDGPIVIGNGVGEPVDAQADETDMKWLLNSMTGFGLHYMPAPAPWQVTESFGVMQSVLEYRGRSLGVRCWDDAEDDALSNVETANGQRPPQPKALDLVRFQIVSDKAEYKGWGRVPGLRYDRRWEYRFLFVPIHNTGAFPTRLRQWANVPASLWPFNENNLGLPQGIAGMEEHWVTVSNYVRRVPVGEVRLARVPDRDERANPYFEDFAAPVIPDGVRPLYADLQDEATSGYLAKLDTKEGDEGPLPKAPPMLPAQTVLLRRKAGGKEGVGSSASFFIRPPATSIENWTIWQSSAIEERGIAEGERNGVLDCIADMNRMVRELSASQNRELDKANGLEVTQLLDDPAVKGVLVKVRMILNLWKRESDTAPSPQYFRFAHKPLKEYLEQADPPLVGGDKLDPKTMVLCRKQVQTRAILQGSAETAAIRVKLHGDNVLAKQRLDLSEGGTIVIPEGCITEIELIPCIGEKDRKNRFGIYQGAEAEEVANVTDGGKLFALRSSAFRIWVETVPPLEENKSASKLPPPSYLPTGEEVFQALRLASVGTYGHEARQIQRLEVAVLPELKVGADQAETNAENKKLLRRWAYASEVHAEIQPWVWRGLPEAGFKQLAGLIKPDARNGTRMPKDMDGEILKDLVEGEAPAYGEREDAAARVQAGIVNYAAPFKLMAEDIGPRVTPFIIYQDLGEQDEVPRYFRVKLVVKSRYAGLEAQTEPQDSPYNHATAVGSEYSWKWEEGAVAMSRKSSYRRILFQGLLRRKLDLPRVKMVIPLMEALSGADEAKGRGERTRPGFIVLTREPLRSPWHRLVAEVDWARVNVSTSAGTVSKERPEYGPDPITSIEAFDMSFKSSSVLKAQSHSDGKAFGLTFEREADAALFPNAGFHFDAPFSQGDLDAGAVDSDWFAKIRFRWEIQPAHVLATGGGYNVSESTQPWSVQLLAPFQWIRFGKEKKPVDLSKVSFQLKDGKLTFLAQGMPALGAPLGPQYGSNTDHPDASPSSLLIFVLWGLVPDFLNAEHSKVAHSIFAFTDAGVREVYRNAALQQNPGDWKTMPQPDGGNFMLLFGRKGDVRGFTSELPEPSADGLAGLDWLVNQFLFPGEAEVGKEKVGQDARLMITRCSPPISSAREAVPGAVLKKSR